MQKVVILRASPRRDANSSILADRVADGARAAGAAVECFDLHQMNIRPCDACDYCQGLGAGECAIDDDMQKLYPSLRECDSLVLASPIYWFTFNAQIKLCIDRWYALQGPDGSALKGKKIGIIMVYGDVDPYTSGAINAIRTYEDAFRYLKAPIVEVLYGSANEPGEIRSQEKLLERAFDLGQKLAK